MKRRILRGILLTLAILTLLAGGAWWWMSYRLEGWVITQLRHEIAGQSKGHYRLEEASVRLGIWPGNMILKDLLLTADTVSFPDMTGIRTVRVPVCRIHGVRWWKTLRENRLHIRSIELDEPALSLKLAPPKTLPVAGSLPPPIRLPSDSLMQAVLGEQLKELVIHEIRISAGRCKILPPAMPPALIQKAVVASPAPARGLTAPVMIDSLNLWLSHIHIQRGVISENALYPAGIQVVNLSCVSHDLRWNTRKGNIQVTRLKLDTTGLHAADIRFRPFAYVRQPTVHMDRLEAPSSNLMQALFRRSLSLNELLVNGLQVVLPPGERQKNTTAPPQQTLYALVAPLLDTLTVQTLRVEEGTISKDRLLFEHVSAYWQSVRLHRSATLTLDDLLYGPSLRARTPAFRFTTKNKRYHLETGEAVYNAYAQELRLKDVRVVPDAAFNDSVSFFRSIPGRIYHLHVPEIVLKGATLRTLLRGHFLKAKELRLLRPDLSADSYRTIDTSQLNRIAAFNLYDVIKTALDSVVIGEVNVESGQVVFRDFRRSLPQNLHAREVNGRITNFRVNETLAQTPGKPFLADDLSVNASVPQYTLMLPDSSHEITIQHIGISTAEKRISIDSIWIQPTIFLMRTLRRNEAINAFIPHAEVRGLNVYELYRDRVLRLTGLYIQDPQIDVTIRRDQAGKKKQGAPVRGFGLSNLNLYPLFSRYFQWVDLGEVLVEHAAYRQHNYLEGKLLRHFEIPDARLRLTSVHINDGPALAPSHLLYAQGFEATLHDYRLGLADSVHEIRFGTIAIRSHVGNERIELLDVNISPTYEGAGAFRTPRRYAFRLPTGLIDGVDLYRLFENRALDAREIRVVQPDITYRFLHQPDRLAPRDTLATDFAGLIRGELSDLKIGQFSVINGRLDFDSNDEVVVQSFQAEGITGALGMVRLNHAANSLRYPFLIADARVEGEIHHCDLVLPDSSYTARIEHMVLSEGGRRLDLDSVSTFPYHLPEERTFSVVDVGVNHVTLTGVDLLKLYTTRDIDLRSMDLQRPQVRITREGKSSGFRERAFNPLQDVDVYRHISRVLSSIVLDTFRITDGTLDVVTDDSLSLHLPEVSTLLTDIRIDSQRRAWDNAFLYAGNAVLQVRHYRQPWNTYFSDLHVGTVTFETATRQIRIDSFGVMPRFSPEVFYDSIGRQTTYMRIFSPMITLSNSNIHDAVLNGRITVGQMNIVSPEFYLYMDQNRPEVLSVIRGLPMDFMHGLNLTLRIDTTRLVGGRLIYEELAEDGQETGIIELKGMFANMYNLTNDPVLLKRNPVLRLEMGSGFMDNGHFSISAFAHQSSPNRWYEYKGEMAAMDLRELNRFLPNAHSVAVESGMLQRATFSVKSRNNESTGEMRMYYKGLKLSFVNKKNPSAEGRAVASALANAVIRQDNPSRHHFRIGHIQSGRDPYRSVIYDMIQAMLSGVKSSAGLAKKEGKDKTAGLRDMIRSQRKRLRKPEPSLEDDPNRKKQRKRSHVTPPAGQSASAAMPAE